MRALSLFFALSCFVSCTSDVSPDDEYVLIEFASKLEEDYQKLQPEQNGQIRK